MSKCKRATNTPPSTAHLGFGRCWNGWAGRIGQPLSAEVATGAPKATWPAPSKKGSGVCSSNNFDELKSHWGWGGFTAQDLKRCRFMARMTALVYNWWSLFLRLADPASTPNRLLVAARCCCMRRLD